jgi:HEAT repeat protein
LIAKLRASHFSQTENPDIERQFEDTLDQLTKLLNSRNSTLSEDAALRMAQIGYSAVEALSVALMSESLHVAVNAARAIGIIGPDAKAAIFNLAWVLQHPDTERRESAACAIGKLKTNPRLSVQALAYALGDNQLSVRQYAAAALGEFDGHTLGEIHNELQIALKDKNKDVRTFSKFALSKIRLTEYELG